MVTRTAIVVDDQPAFCCVARDLLGAAGFDVVGEAGDAAGARAAVERLRPDVVLLDVRLPDGSGVDVARGLRDTASSTLVILTSTADYTAEARNCGVAFIPKIELTVEALQQAVGR
ncbi:MAG TPA: response regulator [Acidimicrobiales bacterium]|nr:response regulator [Acidimicrobiales bacterium]